ncbi:hypothetical protein BD408DRAFT_427722 [Parasitella parasitica]|nr:hypothetical protein BD408DRAFT_427722 [Parasitella parasitica]
MLPNKTIHKKAQELKGREDDAKMLQRMSLEIKPHHSEKEKEKDIENDSSLVGANSSGTMETPVFTSPSPVIGK